MPAQAIVDQGKGYDLALSTTAGDGVILDTERILLINGSCHAGQYSEVGLIQSPGVLAGDTGP